MKEEFAGDQKSEKSFQNFYLMVNKDNDLFQRNRIFRGFVVINLLFEIEMGLIGKMIKNPLLILVIKSLKSYRREVYF
jgi:hypothetical protein